jgi:hypothetical protein
VIAKNTQSLVTILIITTERCAMGYDRDLSDFEWLRNLDVTTTDGQRFTGEESCELAHLVWRRFGRDNYQAKAAWCRMLESNPTVSQFMDLVHEHLFKLKNRKDVLK